MSNTNENVPHRFYFALTNFCNRTCEYCSCHSDPTRATHLGLEKFKELVKGYAAYEAQLEGGEPTISQDFEEIVAFCQSDPACKKVILCTNAVKVPLDELKIKDWFKMFDKKPFVLKPSVNSHLIRHSSVHMKKMIAIAKAFGTFSWKHPSQLIFNVRRIPAPLAENSEQWIVDELKEAGIYHLCNDFFYQRYGQAEDVQELEKPFIIANPVPFDLIAPDGKTFNTDLIGRAIYMKNMK